MARLEAPVMNTRRCAPAARASSTAYWISGLSTIGSISFGLALVAGRKRVPSPATGNTALVTLFIESPASVIPATAGIQRLSTTTLGPCFHGDDLVIQPIRATGP